MCSNTNVCTCTCTVMGGVCVLYKGSVGVYIVHIIIVGGVLCNDGI